MINSGIFVRITKGLPIHAQKPGLRRRARHCGIPSSRCHLLPKSGCSLLGIDLLKMGSSKKNTTQSQATALSAVYSQNGARQLVPVSMKDANMGPT